jgi:large repetitive protein
MQRKIACVSILIALFTFVPNCTLVSAQTVVIPHIDRGWYIPSGSHDPSNTNYLVGDSRTSICGVCANDHRNFFVFNLAGVTQPIASAKLALFVSGGSRPGYFSPDPSENYELHDVVTPIATLVDGTGGVAAHADLGSGVVYGSRTMTAADNGSVIEITLNSSAIAALDAATGLIGIGGRLTTLDAVANEEYTFAWTQFGGEISQLRLLVVPEPSTFLLIGILAISLLGYRRREC